MAVFGLLSLQVLAQSGGRVVRMAVFGLLSLQVLAQ